MITYVDTSTLIKLVIDEPGSEVAAKIWSGADALVAVALIEVEARAALGTAHRSGRLTAIRHRRAVAVLDELVGQLDLADVSTDVITAACALADRHGLRGYDAVHLAAALLVRSDILTSADTDLCDAARREGINVANPLDL